jgi:hypothetical protein
METTVLTACHCCCCPPQVLDELHGILPLCLVDDLEKEYNPVLTITVMMTKSLDTIGKHVPAPVLAGLENQIRAMIADVLACNRIYYTPMPFAYIVHLRWAGRGLGGVSCMPACFLPHPASCAVLCCSVHPSMPVPRPPSLPCPSLLVPPDTVAHAAFVWSA